MAIVSLNRLPRSEARPGEDLQIPAFFADVIGYHLRIAQEASFAAIRQGAGSSDLKPGWYTLLTILSDNPGLTPSEISRLCGRDRSTLTTTLKALDARGLILRERKADDQRSYSVRLTEAGETMLKDLRVIAHAHDDRLDAIVGKDKVMFLAVLRRIVGALTNTEIDEPEAADDPA